MEEVAEVGDVVVVGTFEKGLAAFVVVEQEEAEVVVVVAVYLTMIHAYFQKAS